MCRWVATFKIDHGVVWAEFQGKQGLLLFCWLHRKELAYTRSKQGQWLEKCAKSSRECFRSLRLEVTRRSIRKFNIPLPPRASSRAFELFEFGLFKFPPPLGQKDDQMPYLNVRFYGPRMSLPRTIFSLHMALF